MVRSNFLHFYNNILKDTPEYAKMRETVEDSPWHREDNVALHTDLVVEQYVASMGRYWSKQNLLGALVCAFHDFGKPDAEEVRHNEERGTYRRYAGHEILSARMWETYAVRNYVDLQYRLGLNAEDIYKVGWAIEHHLPFGTKKEHKLESLRATIDRTVGMETFTASVMADCRGRISDNHEEKIKASLDWLDEFEQKTENISSGVHETAVCRDAPTLFVLIGPSGSGKTTYSNRLAEHNPNLRIFSLDELRMRLHGNINILDVKERYSVAWKDANEDNTFKQQCDDEFRQLLITQDDIIIDNVNATPKSRRQYITQAKQKGYRVVCVLFPNDVEVLVERQKTRGDKCVPEAAVRNQYNRITYPMAIEYDTLRMVLPE